jgi:hypothetical protein
MLPNITGAVSERDCAGSLSFEQLVSAQVRIQHIRLRTHLGSISM